jgi:methionine-S-sulfoxide reductase
MVSELATFAGGCFWCMTPPFAAIPGVLNVVAGLTGEATDGKIPSHEEVRDGTSTALESVQVTYDPAVCSYETLLNMYWHQIDPTDEGGQFTDRGYSYLTAIFCHNSEQLALAEASKRALEASGRFAKPVVTMVTEMETFFPLGEEHQNYHAKNPEFYCDYRAKSGRDKYLKNIWGD